MTPTTVKPTAEARSTFGLPEQSPIGIVVGLDGVPVMVAEDGSATAILPGGWPHPGIAHATMRRRP